MTPSLTTGAQSAPLTFVVGETMRIAVSFTYERVAKAPDVVTLRLKPPTADLVVTTDVVAVDEQTGMYYYDVVLTEDGLWKWRIEGTGSIAAVAQGEQWVDPANV